MLQKQSEANNVYSKAISVSWTAALGAMSFGNGLWYDYVAYRTRARLNVFYSTLCLKDSESGAFLEASISMQRDSYFSSVLPTRSRRSLPWRCQRSTTQSSGHLGRQRRVRVDNITERHPCSCGFSQFSYSSPKHI